MMDLPVHIASGAFIGHAVLAVERAFPQQATTRSQQIKPFAAVFLLGVLTHLLLDAIPHYDWLFYIEIFKPLPYHWLIPQFIVAVPVLAFVVFSMHDNPAMAVISVFGGVYPDIEKILYFDFHLPRSLTIFRWHSCYLSQWTPWEANHKIFLIVTEIWLLVGLLGGMYWLASRRINLRDFPNSFRMWRQLVEMYLKEIETSFRTSKETI